MMTQKVLFKILFLFILIFHISHVNADEIYNLIKIPKENGKSFTENSLIKAKYYSKKTKHD